MLTFGFGLRTPVLIFSLLVGSAFSLGIMISLSGLGGRAEVGALPCENREEINPSSIIRRLRILNCEFSFTSNNLHKAMYKLNTSNISSNPWKKNQLLCCKEEELIALLQRILTDCSIVQVPRWCQSHEYANTAILSKYNQTKLPCPLHLVTRIPARASSPDDRISLSGNTNFYS